MKPLSRLFGVYLLVLIVPMVLLINKNSEEYVVVIDTKLESKASYKEENVVSIVINEEETPIFFGDLTSEELIAKFNSILKNDFTNMGETFVNYAIKYEVDPYIAVAIMLHETGCNSRACSKLVTSCNNVGGQKANGTNKCGTGAYARFSSLDTGIEKFYSNLSRNYVKKGLVTPEQINKKYAESTNWAGKINYYMNWLKNI